MKTANSYRYTSEKTGIKGVPITLTVLFKSNCMYWENGPNFVMIFFLFFFQITGISGHPIGNKWNETTEKEW